VTLTVMLLQFTEAKLQVTVPLPARFRLTTAPPAVPEFTVKKVDAPFDHVTALVQSTTLESE
jgi:hypothetical protein